jgi:UDP-glucose 4-epimerase
MAKILVTGGLGFIGSHTVVELQKAGHQPIIVDDLSNSNTKVLEGITAITGQKPLFIKADLKHKQAASQIFTEHPGVEGVIHFAAFKAVGESVQKPLEYYENNLASLVYLLQAMRKFKCTNFIFSSSCTVYGQAQDLPIKETSPVLSAESPYGNTKQIGEEIIRDAIQAHSFKAIALRYFNPIGAHPSAKIGELPIGTPLNLIPFVTQTGAGIRKQLQVFGNDYPTPDGTNIRDYIHVTDVAQAHVVAVERLLASQNKTPYEVFNLGTGKGSSVLEVIKAFEKVSGQKLNYKIASRRAGDVVAAYADTQKANQELGWQAKKNLEEAIADAWRWQKSLVK